VTETIYEVVEAEDDDDESAEDSVRTRQKPSEMLFVRGEERISSTCTHTISVEGSRIADFVDGFPC